MKSAAGSRPRKSAVVNIDRQHQPNRKMQIRLSLVNLTESIKWFRSFLSSRSQKVKIGEYLSNSINLQSGVPQGGIISPLLYIINVADLQLWLKFSRVTTYADDTKTCVSHRLLCKVKEMCVYLREIIVFHLHGSYLL